MNKKKLAVLLSRIKTFEKPNVKLEQYQTESEVAAQAIWNAFMNKDIKDKAIIDLGCGTGIFGLGALILGAKKVTFVDIDKKALSVAKENAGFLEKELGIKFNTAFINKDVKGFKGKAEIVLQNPPFGVKKSHTDKLFLLKSMEIAPVIYSFHKIESREFIEKFVNENNFRVKEIIKIKFPLRRIFSFHRKKTYFVDVGCWKIVRK